MRNLHNTWSSMASLRLLWSASLVPWQAILTPFMSCVMLSLTWVDEIFPPQSPGWFVTPPSLIRGIPSLYQLSRTGGLLELESQKRLASVPTVSAFGSTRIFKVSGMTASAKRTKKKREEERRKSFSSVGEKHHHNDDNGRAGAHKASKKKKFFFCFAREGRKKRAHKKSCRSNQITRRKKVRQLLPHALQLQENLIKY